MNTQEFYRNLVELESVIKSKGLSRATAQGHVNWVGEEVAITLYAGEPYDEKGYWHSERTFEGALAQTEDLLRNAFSWVHELPDAESRAIELMIQKLNKLAGNLPKGSTDIARAAWAEIHGMLMAKAERLAKNGLPSPNRIAELRA
jgi:hypothetical protein